MWHVVFRFGKCAMEGRLQFTSNAKDNDGELGRQQMVEDGKDS